jgi:hypothetical protein
MFVLSFEELTTVHSYELSFLNQQTLVFHNT